MIRRLRPDATTSHAIFRLLAQFQETPELRLTAWQASRLFCLDAAVCQSLLEALVEMGVLERDRDGHYLSATTRPAPRRPREHRAPA